MPVKLSKLKQVLIYFTICICIVYEVCDPFLPMHGTPYVWCSYSSYVHDQYMAFNLHLQYVTFFCGCMQYIFVVLQMGSFISVKVWVYKIGIQFQLLNVPLLLYKSWLVHLLCNMILCLNMCFTQYLLNLFATLTCLHMSWKSSANWKWCILFTEPTIYFLLLFRLMLNPRDISWRIRRVYRS